MSIGHHFYSKGGGCAILVLAAIPVIAASFAFAQSKKKEKGLRALAVVEMTADGKSATRLIPVAILVNGRFWDASIYLADPRPMALEPGNVYEVERSGKPLGFFTVTAASEDKDRWSAMGDWQPQVEKPPTAAKPAPSWHAEDDDRPVLHKRHPETSDQPAAASPGPSSASAPATSSSTAASSPSAPVDDPNRPLLRRGKPNPPPQGPEEQPVQPSAPPRPAESKPAAPSKTAEVLPAISDAGGPDPHSYAYPWTPDEQQKLTKAVSDIALAEVTRHAKGIPALRHSPAAAFDQTTVRVFDVDSNNNPEVVLTARIPAAAAPAPGSRAAKPAAAAPAFFFYVTVVGQPDLYGQMRKLFSSVTDSAHLDAFPRLELIDAVDAEGTGRGNLLFRAWSGDTASYRLYHVGPDSLRKLFDGAASD
ncbi:MAG TPA: hypothetical protein VEC95_00880 [Terriglobales bacterium]|nr:hypothetical protein [Terriglobales bacterium]